MVIFAGLAVFPSGSVKLCGESPTGSVKKFTKKRPAYLGSGMATLRPGMAYLSLERVSLRPGGLVWGLKWPSGGLGWLIQG